MIKQSQIRNFAIIAHIDHGKSTLADRMLELCGVVKKAEKQTLDSNPIERERGITIKLAPVRMLYQMEIPHQVEISHNFKSVRDDKADLKSLSALSNIGSNYILNLIDTPGHVDFSYEVSRALAACEGVVLLVDATKGIQAQTLAHYREAKKLNLKMIPVINKIDLSLADVEATKLQMMETFGIEEKKISLISAKTGKGIEGVLKRIVEEIPAPVGVIPTNVAGRHELPLRALVFNSQYDEHQGVLAWVKIVDGSLKRGEEITFWGTETNTQANQVGYFELRKKQTDELKTGEVGYVVTGLKNPRLVQAGDTLTLKKERDLKSLHGYNPPKPMIFASFYPIDQGEYPLLGDALEKLKLLDSSLTFTAESSPLLGNGFRIGFLGLLHAEIVQERLEREFGLAVFASAPNVMYKIQLRNKRVKEQKNIGRSQEDVSQDANNIQEIHSPQELPDPTEYEAILEPMLKMTVFCPDEYTGKVMQLFQEHRAKMNDMKYIGNQVRLDSTSKSRQVHFEYDFPLGELVSDFYSQLKSVSSGYASLDYQIEGWQEADLVKLDILLAGEMVPALSRIVPRFQAEKIGRKTVGRLAEVVPRHNFEIAVQAAIGGKILARSTIKPFRKDVTAKLYGGDQTRKDKLLKKQKKGKKKMKQMGRVSLPPDTFWKLLK